MKLKSDSTPVIEDESWTWKCTNMFNTAVSCKSRSCSLFIDSSSVFNRVSRDLISKLGLVREPLVKPYELIWINGGKMTVSLVCKLDFYFRKHCKESVNCDVLPMIVRKLLLG